MRGLSPVRTLVTGGAVFLPPALRATPLVNAGSKIVRNAYYFIFPIIPNFFRKVNRMFWEICGKTGIRATKNGKTR